MNCRFSPTLRGTLFSISDSVLLRFRHELGRLHPFRKYPDPSDPELNEVTDALKVLADLHRARNSRPIADTVNALLEAVRAHAAFAMRPTGHQTLANVYRICDLARSFELSGGISFRGFVEELDRSSGKGRRARSAGARRGGRRRPADDGPHGQRDSNFRSSSWPI